MIRSTARASVIVPDGVPKHLVVVISDRWCPKAESCFTRHLLTIQGVYPDVHVTSTDAGALRVARAVGAAVYAGEYDPKSVSHLVYYSDPHTRPVSPAPNSLTSYTFVGTRPSTLRMTPGGRDYPVVDQDRTRPLPPAMHPANKPMPPRNQTVTLPVWLRLI